jgi:anthranilate synthase/aminodeoxychorismate synthase-like glutamine amidotransferase
MSARKVKPAAARVLLIDNYDSFTFNLVQRLGELGAEVEVVRNDALSVDAILAKKPERIVLSPGPCTPAEAGICVPLVKRLAGLDGKAAPSMPWIPMLGVCLGHQSLGAAFGASVIRAPAPVHGKADEILHDGKALFQGAPKPLAAGRYHSLIVEEKTLPPTLRAVARNRDGIVMALRHAKLPLFGLQFHPESILTPDGQTLLANFLAVPLAKAAR